MIIQDGGSFLEIVFLETGAAGTPEARDLRLKVEVTAVASVVGGPFSGRNDAVWIEHSRWTRFIESLRRLDQARRGEAQIVGASPGRFKLTIRIADRTGHLIAEGWVGRQYSDRNADAHDRVTFSIPVDPSTLGALITDLETLGR